MVDVRRRRRARPAGARGRSGARAGGEIDAVVAGYRRIDAPAIPAGALGMLGERLYAAGRGFGPVEPLYLRAPDVTLSVPKRVGS
ncbi:hypothetical protein GCM10025881_25340 [Pseudolysinimonas kribbensis]|uniref:Uncharacterized protein n=1 Tax=Pseudolysinimonas kribbensis TaxID=433641 RepID=A0ABQ6K9R3_9MICO|nr:hypothetical protein GCM10025881_25340 [Pseudolysinimonas kribbensis]